MAPQPDETRPAAPGDDESLLWYTALHHLIDEVVFIHREDRSIAFVSPSVETVLGYTQDEFTRLSTPELIHPDDLPEAVETAVRLRAEPGCSYRSTLRIRRADGRWIWVEIVGQNLLEEPGVHGVIQTLRDVSERRALEQRLVRQAHHDALTGLANRRSFIETLEGLLAADTVPPVGVVYLDLDRFKPVNDTLGHAAGDEVLCEVARRIQGAARARDLPARLGGDEFVVLAHGIGDEATARAAGSRLHLAVTGPVEVTPGTEVDVAVSVGVAFTRAPCSADDLIARADAALYEAKKGGAPVVVRLPDGGDDRR